MLLLGRKIIKSTLIHVNLASVRLITKSHKKLFVSIKCFANLYLRVLGVLFPPYMLGRPGLTIGWPDI